MINIEPYTMVQYKRDRGTSAIFGNIFEKDDAEGRKITIKMNKKKLY